MDVVEEERIAVHAGYRVLSCIGVRVSHGPRLSIGYDLPGDTRGLPTRLSSATPLVLLPRAF
jgi:hypothetical protein